MYLADDWWHVKVRIKAAPREREVDGVRLDTYEPGTIRDVSPSIGAWLIAQGYADSEMRSPSRPKARESAVKDAAEAALDRPADSGTPRPYRHR